MLDESDIEKFQEIYKKQFGKEISTEEAYEKGAKLLRLVQLVYRPITLEQYEKLQQRRKEIYGDENNKIKTN